MRTLREVIEIEKSISTMLSDLTNQIETATQQSKMDCVNQITSGIFTVNISQMYDNIWDPDYYNQYSQAKLVKNALKNCKTATSFESKLRTLIEEKKVNINSRNSTRLNPKTIEVLKSFLKNI